jgi:hypothetical protein
MDVPANDSKFSACFDSPLKIMTRVRAVWKSQTRALRHQQFPDAGQHSTIASQ